MTTPTISKAEPIDPVKALRDALAERNGAFTSVLRGLETPEWVVAWSRAYRQLTTERELARAVITHLPAVLALAERAQAAEARVAEVVDYVASRELCGIGEAMALAMLAADIAAGMPERSRDELRKGTP